jgi:NAD(P)-dependent dehydrogenase (short-subunit alcohol dehydrogenase family)
MTEPSFTVLILGGYGTFGGRLVRLLADEPGLTIMIAGRSLERAQEFRAALEPKARLVLERFDRDGDVEAQLRALMPTLVVDASGPFQAYGDDPYCVVKACIALGIHYLDLADGSDFVAGIEQFDEEAHRQRVFVLSGASSFPLLTAAAVRHLAVGMHRMEAVAAGIAPSPFADIGPNVVRAIASYAGKPVRGADGTRIGYGLIQSYPFVIAPPGRMPLARRRFSLIDAPDIRLLPLLWPTLRSVWTGAGTVPVWRHRLLNLFAWLVRLRLFPPLTLFAPVMSGILNRLRFGERRGGMFVVVSGPAVDGSIVKRSWHMIAEGDDGPFVPAMAADLIIRRCLAGIAPQAGARPATGDVDLSEYEASFAKRAIYSGTRHSLPGESPLYRRLLGEAWETLPPEIRAMHSVEGTLRADGTANVSRGRGPLALLACALFRFPRSGENIPVTVTFRARKGAEIWRRRFANRAFSSRQSEGRGRYERLLVERFGPFSFGLALVREVGQLRLIVRGWSFLGIPLPRVLAPRSDSRESVEDGRFNFHVELSHPFTGPIVRYSGSLVPRAHAVESAAEEKAPPRWAAGRKFFSLRRPS